MKVTRKDFLKAGLGAALTAATSGAVAEARARAPATAAGAAAASGRAAANQAPGPRRGVSLYSYSGELGVTMTMEDCFVDMYDMGARGLEILSSAHVENYPHPSDAWLERWHALLARYDIVPVEYGHWVDSRLHAGRELSTRESLDMLTRDIRIAHQLGFTVMRTKLGVTDELLAPVSNWREIISEALPFAEHYGVRMCPELHQPTALKSKMVDDYVEFIQKTGTKHFGLNIDFGVFQLAEGRMKIPGLDNPPSAPEDMVALLPYTYACHAKFTQMTEAFVEATHPYEQVVALMRKHGWSGYLLSEYEGDNKEVPGHSSDQLRRQHVMLRRLLGEA